MTTPVYVSPFTGTVVTPTDVSYLALPFSSNQELFWPSTVNGSQVVAARIIDCVASAGSLSIALPAADQGTLGSDILFRNLGAFAFTITDNEGGASVSVPVGQSLYFYLIDNTSAAGEWNNVAFGVGTSFADAATLAGLGLSTSSGKLVTTQNVVNITATPTVNNQSRAATFVWNSGAGTFNLPNFSTLSEGWFIGIRNNGTGQLTINPVSPSTINDQVSLVFNPGDSGFILFDISTNGFYTVGFVAPSAVTFTAATYDVDAIVGNTFNLTAFAPIIQTYIAQSGTRTTTLAVTLPAITQIYVLVNNTNQTGYDITFVNEGSSSPALVLTSGSIATVLSDGTDLFPLTASSTGLIYASDGSAATPSFSFNNDTATGMYLVGTGVLGLTANGVELINIDGSDLLNPLVTINSRLVAQLIDGGQF
jgi:hypothetical protein